MSECELISRHGMGNRQNQNHNHITSFCLFVMVVGAYFTNVHKF